MARETVTPKLGYTVWGKDDDGFFAAVGWCETEDDAKEFVETEQDFYVRNPQGTEAKPYVPILTILPYDVRPETDGFVAWMQRSPSHEWDGWMSGDWAATIEEADAYWQADRTWARNNGGVITTVVLPVNVHPNSLHSSIAEEIQQQDGKSAIQTRYLADWNTLRAIAQSFIDRIDAQMRTIVHSGTPYETMAFVMGERTGSTFFALADDLAKADIITQL